MNQTAYVPVFASAEGEAATLAAYDDIVRRWSCPCTEHDVATSLGTTHVIVSGPEDAEPIVLLHAFFATATSWYALAGHLSDRYRVYAVDILGDVGKSWPIGPMASLEHYSRWFSELIDGLGIGRLNLVGNSVGGFFAAHFAMQFPDRVSRLVLISPAATFHRMPAFYRNMFIPKALRLISPRVSTYDQAVDGWVDWMNAGVAPDGPWDHLFRLSLRHGSGTNRVFPRRFTSKEFARMKARALLMVGDHEMVYPPQSAISAARRMLPGIETAEVPGAHHVAAVVQPRLVGERILQFFAT